MTPEDEIELQRYIGFWTGVLEALEMPREVWQEWLDDEVRLAHEFPGPFFHEPPAYYLMRLLAPPNIKSQVDLKRYNELVSAVTAACEPGNLPADKRNDWNFIAARVREILDQAR